MTVPAQASQPAYVITETVFFGRDLAYHRFTLAQGEWHNFRRFIAVGNQATTPRCHDLTNMRLFQSQSAHDFDTYPELRSDIPIHEHSSFSAFLAHVRYRWSLNLYRKVPRQPERS